MNSLQTCIQFKSSAILSSNISFLTVAVFLTEDCYFIINNSTPLAHPHSHTHANHAPTPHTQPLQGLISERISCIAFRFPPLTAPLLPNECNHSSVLVVWRYLGRAIPCLMSSEAKISILASEWLGSLWERLCVSERDQWKMHFFFSVTTLKLRGTTKRAGRQTNIFRETAREKK